MSLGLLYNKITTVCPIDGVCPEKNRIDFKAEATQGEKDAAQAILTAYNADPESVKTVDKKREESLEAQGCTQCAKLEALWKKIMSADSTEADALLTIENQVKIDIPKQ